MNSYQRIKIRCPSIDPRFEKIIIPSINYLKKMIFNLHQLLFEGHPSNFLKTFFNFAYILCISPYRLVIDKDGVVTAKQWIPQKMLCFIVHLLSLLYIFLYRWNTLIPETAERTPPTQYFFLMSHICSHLLSIVTFKRVWCNKKEFVKILSFLCEKIRKSTDTNNGGSTDVDEGGATITTTTTTVDSRSRPSFLEKIGAKPYWKQLLNNGLFFKLICIGYLIAGLCYANSSLRPLKYWQNHSWLTENNSFIGKIYPKIGWASDSGKHETSSIYTCISIILAVSAFARGLTRYFGNLLLVSGVLTLWNVVHLSVDYLKSVDPLLRCDNSEDKDVRKQCGEESSGLTFRLINKCNLSIISPIIQPSNGDSKTQYSTAAGEGNACSKWNIVYGLYLKIRNLARLINIAFGSITCLSVARAILYNSANMDEAFFSDHILEKMLLVLLTGNDVVVFLLAADINSQMDNFRLWVSNDDNRKFVPVDQMHVLLQELNSVSIGIRGGNMFTITYSLLWNVLTTVMTYFIICVQTRLGHDKPGGLIG